MRFVITNNVEVIDPPKLFVQECSRLLTITNPEHEEAVKFGRFVRHIPKYIKLFETTPTGIIMPRGFVLTALKICIDNNIELPDVVDQLPEEHRINVKSKINVRDYQDKFIREIIDGGSGVGVAPPGSGKTCSGLEIIARLGLKTLWLTHTTSLAKQTLSRINDFLELDSVGFIGQGKCKIGDVTVALVQSLVRKDLESIAKEFSLVIIDETHHVPAAIFSTIVRQLWARRFVGLSATPYRKDGLEALMFNIIGPQLSKVEKSTLIEAGHIIPAKIIQRNTGISIYGEDYQDIMRGLYNSNKRIDVICSDVIAESSMGNICIILTNKIDYGRKIANRINEFGLSAELVFSSEAVYQGKRVKPKMVTMPKKQREQIIENFIGGKLDILVATYSLLAEGFDYQPLNRLFFATPISNKNRTLLEQTCGRVERTAKNKVDAIVYDYVDDNSLLLHQAGSRIQIYEDNLMEVVSSLK